MLKTSSGKSSISRSRQCQDEFSPTVEVSQKTLFEINLVSEAQSWRKRNVTHQRSHERTPASAHASALSAHASVHESAHKSWLSLCYNPIQRLPLECSRECSRGCPRKCTRSGLVVCHLVCFHLRCSETNLGQLQPSRERAHRVFGSFVFSQDNS